MPPTIDPTALRCHAVAVPPARTGVFIGISWTEYARLAAEAGAPVTAYTAQGAVLSVCPGRVAYHHGLKGPAVAVDTACSSSLVAASAAREAVLTAAASGGSGAGGSGGAAVAGGINMMLSPATTFMFKKANMLSADGRCKALDAGADGYVRSEVRPPPPSRPLPACGWACCALGRAAVL